MLGAVIFDFDGVIADSESLHLRSFNMVLAQYGIEIKPKDYYRDFLGLTDLDCFKLLVSKRLGLAEKQVSELVAQKEKTFARLLRDGGCVIEGVRDFLNILGQNRIPMAVCSGALLAEIELLLEQSGLRDFFEQIVSAEQVKKGKPNPECFLVTLEKLNRNRSNPIVNEQCIVIEDSHWGLEAAQAARMHTIAVTNSYDAEELTMAEKTVSRLDELTIQQLQDLCS
ncbi:MAG: HAD family phosphatase [Sedimentisphaerales bacterium]|nr:HAD family phosphatase [Sedimentisphaerales bacterium]